MKSYLLTVCILISTSVLPFSALAQGNTSTSSAPMGMPDFAKIKPQIAKSSELTEKLAKETISCLQAKPIFTHSSTNCEAVKKELIERSNKEIKHSAITKMCANQAKDLKSFSECSQKHMTAAAKSAAPATKK